MNSVFVNPKGSVARALRSGEPRRDFPEQRLQIASGGLECRCVQLRYPSPVMRQSHEVENIANRHGLSRLNTRMLILEILMQSATQPDNS